MQNIVIKTMFQVRGHMNEWMDGLGSGSMDEDTYHNEWTRQ